MRLTEMLAELESSPLVTVLVPQRRFTNEGGCIRVNMSVPPKWYRALCNRHPSSRGTRRGGFDTRVRRQSIIRILTRLSNNLTSTSKYAPEIIAIARQNK